MSYSSLIQSLPDKLTQPAGIATLASVGLHGFLWFFLPLLPIASETPPAEIQQAVEVVELTPAEQSRLPLLSSSQLPDFQLPPGANFGSPSPQSNLFPLLPPLTSAKPLPPIDNSSLYSLPFAPPPPLAMLPPPPVMTQLPPPPAFLLPNPTPLPNPAPAPAPGTAFQQLPDLAALTPDPRVLEQPRPVPAPAPVVPSPDAQAANPETPPEPVEDSPLPQKIPNLALEKLREKQELFSYDPTRTKEVDVVDALSAWSEKAIATAGKPWKPLDLVPQYPLKACHGQLKGTAVIGVLVNEEGQIAEDPELIQSTGYQPLNQNALDVVNSYEFEATGEKQPYLVRVEFQYQPEACPAAEPLPS